MDSELANQAWLRIQQAGRIMICGHTRPDGDAIGSVLGLGQALMEAGKEVQIVMADGVPTALRFLPGSEQIVTRPEGQFDLVIVVDCGRLDRTGNILDGVGQIDMNIDHHPDNNYFAEINLVDEQAASASQIIAGLLAEWDLPISQTTAANLLAGLITDTIGFKTENMRPEVLRVAADLFEAGAELPSLYHSALAEKTFESVKYMGLGLSKLSHRNGLVWTTLTLADRGAANYSGRDDADLVNIISAVDSAKVALIFVEQHGQEVKISWRTRETGIDVSRVAHHYGGGGHRAAAGAMVPGKLDEVVENVLSVTAEMLEI